METPSTHTIARSIGAKYLQELYALKRKPQWTAHDLVHARELREAIQVFRNLKSRDQFVY